jgi:hypothetical protein
MESVERESNTGDDDDPVPGMNAVIFFSILPIVKVLTKVYPSGRKKAWK